MWLSKNPEFQAETRQVTDRRQVHVSSYFIEKLLFLVQDGFGHVQFSCTCFLPVKTRANPHWFIL